ncbi:MAG: glycosyl transferase family 1 [Prevotella sp.]|jgi:hypothetical protein|nr:glycosyl transferase family 1 [Prevotella sp.]
MKIYLYDNRFVSKIDIWRDYMALVRGCHRTDQLSEADLVHILGVWDHKASRLARKAREMGIPYVISPLGGLSSWNLYHPHLKRRFQRSCYQKAMVRKADAVIVTTPLEMQFLRKLKWNYQLYRIPNPILAQFFSESDMRSKMDEVYEKVLARHEEIKAELIRKRSGEDTPEHIILRQLLQIHSRMPHRNIPQTYLDALQTLLHDTDYDDDILAEELKEQKILKFSRRIFQVMTTRTGLTEGFMPVESLNDRKVKRILSYCRPQQKLSESQAQVHKPVEDVQSPGIDPQATAL